VNERKFTPSSPEYTEVENITKTNCIQWKIYSFGKQWHMLILKYLEGDKKKYRNTIANLF
jgi:hypothetical protein